MERYSRPMRPRTFGQPQTRPWPRRAGKVVFYGMWLFLLAWALMSVSGPRLREATTEASQVLYDLSKGTGNMADRVPALADDLPRPQHVLVEAGNEELAHQLQQQQVVPREKQGTLESEAQQAGEQVLGGQVQVDARVLPSSPTTPLAGSVDAAPVTQAPPPPQPLVQVDAGTATAEQQDAAAAAAAAAATSGEVPDENPRVVSHAKVQVVPDSKGQLIKHYYRFSNVQLTRDSLRFFYPEGFKPPAERWVDYISGNSSTPDLPTKLVIKGEVTGILRYYMNVSYVPAAEKQPKCKGWIEKPAFLLQVRYATNIWHSWNEGLMGTFQTLRELGYLPLVQIDNEGYMREVVEGMGGAECALEHDPITGTPKPGIGCTKTGQVQEARCDAKNQAWCTPGVVSYRRFEGGPMLVYYTDASVHNRWRHMYYSMTEDIRSLDDLEGYCYRTLIVGKSSTLNFYQYNTANLTSQHIEARKEAMAVFKSYILTAQQQAIATQHAHNPQSTQFYGYAPPSMELLRRGIGPENIGLADAIGAMDLPADGVVENMGTLEEGWQVEAAQLNAATAAAEAVAGGDQAAGAAAVEQGTGATRPEGTSSVAVTVGTRAATDALESSDGQHADADVSQMVVVARVVQGSAQTGGEVSEREASHGAADHAEEGQEEEEGEEAAAGTGAAGTAAAGTGVVAARRRSARRRGGRRLSAEGAVEAALAATDAASAAAAEAADAAQEAERREAALEAMRAQFGTAHAAHKHEPFRPVVTYMCRPFFSRGVLNEVDVLRYILRNYNVTLRVTTFQEPLLEVMDLMGHTDVLIGMHGAGWTNALFIKPGASAMQMYPYGWRLKDTGAMIRGANYKEIALASDCPYTEWINQLPGYAFFRRIDFKRGVQSEYFQHPGPEVPRPANGLPGPPWVYQNTYVDIESFGRSVDEAMAGAGIPKMATAAVAS